ncbi:hypothetical protein [Megalodesulfovibrio paquesii]
MAVRKKLGDDPLARRAGAAEAGTASGASPLDVVAPPTAPRLPDTSPAPDMKPSQDERGGLAADLAILFPLPHFGRPEAPDKGKDKTGRAERAGKSEHDERWRGVLDEQFRRAVLSLPTIFGRPEFSAPQFADACALLLRELLASAGLARDGLTFDMDSMLQPAGLAPVLPRAVALVLLHGAFCALHILCAEGKLPRRATLTLHLEAIPQTGECMLRLVDTAAHAKNGDTHHALRILDRDRLWPFFKVLGLSLARRGCRLFLFTATTAELRLIAPVQHAGRLAA